MPFYNNFIYKSGGGGGGGEGEGRGRGRGRNPIPPSGTPLTINTDGYNAFVACMIIPVIPTLPWWQGSSCCLILIEFCNVPYSSDVSLFSIIPELNRCLVTMENNERPLIPWNNSLYFDAVPLGSVRFMGMGVVPGILSGGKVYLGRNQRRKIPLLVMTGRPS